MAIAFTRPGALRPPRTLHDRFHAQLARFNHRRFGLAYPDDDLAAELELDYEMRISERNFVERERRAVAPTAENAPQTVDAFMAWGDDLRATAVAQDESLYPWLAEHATLDELRWFVSQEAIGDQRQDDLLAMTAVRLPMSSKMAIAGAAHDAAVRRASVSREIVSALVLEPDIDDTVWESLAVSNLMTALAANRRYVCQSMGALAVADATGARRAAWLATGLARVGALPVSSTLGLRRNSADPQPTLWTAEVLGPLLAGDARAASYLAEGALMRLSATGQCLERYSSFLLASPGSPAGA